MRTTYRIREPYASIFLQCAKDMPCNSPVRPERFIKVMEENQGSLGMMTGHGLAEDGLERRNPVIAAMGDSVTAGHFEMLVPATEEGMKAFFKKMHEDGPRPAIEVTDVRESYVEQFRAMLIDKYERTSVSTVNCGIAGDNLIQMDKRLYRDVIQLQPHLVLINGSLNWDAGLGSTEFYHDLLRSMVQRLKAETAADIVLLTHNAMVPMSLFPGQEPAPYTLPERVEAIREIAKAEQVCLADTYAVWEAARDAGCPWEELLANRTNHPSAEGHTVYAMTLMKLFE